MCLIISKRKSTNVVTKSQWQLDDIESIDVYLWLHLSHFTTSNMGDPSTNDSIISKWYDNVIIWGWYLNPVNVPGSCIMFLAAHGWNT